MEELFKHAKNIFFMLGIHQMVFTKKKDNIINSYIAFLIVMYIINLKMML